MIRIAIILASGMGGRLYPLTKVIPKEMFPILGKPAIQYIIDECIEAGIEKVIVLTRFDSEITQQYFTKNNVYDAYVEKLGIEVVDENYEKVNFISAPKLFNDIGESLLYVIDKCNIPDDYIAVLSGDDIIFQQNAIKSVLECYNLNQNPTIAYQTVDKKRAEKFGNVILKDELVLSINEKSNNPKTCNALLTKLIINKGIMEFIKDTNYKLDLAISRYCSEHKVNAVEIDGDWLNIDNFDDFLQANLKVKEGV